MTDKNEHAVVAGVELTHPDRVLYPWQGITKRDLARYLETVSDRMLPHVSNRLISLVRCPEGRDEECFFQRHGGTGIPGEIRRQTITEKDGGKDEYLYVTDVKGLVAAVQVGVLEFHIWGSRVDNIEKPDRIVFDLDPAPSLAFDAVKDAAREIRDRLDALGLTSFPLLTGGKGIHVVVPVTRNHDWDTVKDFARGFAKRMSLDSPDKYVTTMRKDKRQGRIFIDYLRNDRANTAIAPFSPRAREGAPLAWPVSWDGLGRVEHANDVTVANARRRLGGDPWADYAGVRQSLTKAVRDEIRKE